MAKRAGMRGTAESMDGSYTLPEGMADPCAVVVVEWVEGTPWLIVEDEGGRRWQVQHWLVDCGFEYRWRGRYVHESHPELLDELHRKLARGWEHVPPSCSRDRWAEEMTRTLRKVLLRNGRDPDGPAPEVRRMRS